MPFTRIRKENDNNKIQKETDKVTDIKKSQKKKEALVLNIVAPFPLSFCSFKCFFFFFAIWYNYFRNATSLWCGGSLSPCINVSS